jgi:hypothetical protein
MAKVIERDVQSQEISGLYSIWKLVIIGAVSGLLFWLLTFLLENFVIAPLFCGSANGATACANKLMISGNIAMIIVAVAGIIAMVRLRMTQPLIVAVATVAALWGLAQWTGGLPIWEMIMWSGLVYLMAYLLFSWIVRFDRIWPVVVIILIIIIGIRIAINL